MRNIVPPKGPVNPTLTVALDYIKRWPDHHIFPVARGKKTPPCESGYQAAASNDPEQIKKWDKRYPKCSWGVEPLSSGIIVLDADLKPGKNGQASLTDIEMMYGDLPPTSMVQTPSGGLHYRFKATAKIKHKFRINGFGEHLDSPHYTLIPGNVIAKKNCSLLHRTYTYKNNLPLADAPDWFLKLPAWKPLAHDSTAGADAVIEVDQAANVEWAINYLTTDAPDSIEDQNGNNTTFKVAAELRGHGISRDEAKTLMAKYYNVKPHCVPIWSLDGDLGLYKVIDNAYDYASIDAPGEATAEADFADDALPPLSAKEKKASDKAAATNLKRQAEAGADKCSRYIKECALIVQPPSFVRYKTKKMMSKAAFDIAYSAGIKGSSDMHKRAIKSVFIKRFDGVCYQPHRADVAAPMFETINGDKYFNLFRSNNIVPLEGEPTLFLSHVGYLVPDEKSREYFLDWLAWIVQHPDQKAMFAPLLLGPKRTGKSWIARMLKAILGAHNCSEPNTKRVASDFNGWIAYKQLVIIHELREKGARTLADTLKTLITEDTVPINLKGIEAFEIENVANFLTITNHSDAIHVDVGEGRYLVIHCADAPRFGRGTPKSKAYYRKLFACTPKRGKPSDEACRVLRWLLDRKIKLDCLNIAPDTTAKDEMVDAGRNDLEKYLRAALETRSPPMLCSIINTGDVLLSAKHAEDVEPRLCTLNNVEAALREIGSKPLLASGTGGGRFRTVKGRIRLWVASGRMVSYYASKTPEQIAAIFDKGQAAIAAHMARGEGAVIDDTAEIEEMLS